MNELEQQEFIRQSIEAVRFFSDLNKDKPGIDFDLGRRFGMKDANGMSNVAIEEYIKENQKTFFSDGNLFERGKIDGHALIYAIRFGNENIIKVLKDFVDEVDKTKQALKELNK